MITIIFADMYRSARVWLGAMIVVAMAAFAAIVPATMTESGLRDMSLAGLAIIAIAATIIVLTTIAVMVVLGSVMRLTVALRRRSYALWQTIGMSPLQVTLIVLCQLIVVSALGAAIGAPVGALVIPQLAELSLQGSNGVDELHLSISPSTVVLVAGIVVLIAVAVGSGGARRAARTKPLEVLRESPLARRPRVWPRWIIAAVLVAVVAQMLSGFAASTKNGSGSQSILIGPLLVAATAVLGPVIFPRVMRLWTAVVPVTASSSWFIARANTLFAVDRSSSVVASLLVAVALPGGFAAGDGTVSSAKSILSGVAVSSDSGGAIALILGGPVLLAAAGAAASTVMSSGARSREGALLSAAGAPSGFSLLTAFWEAVIQVGTAALLAIVLVAITAVSEAIALSSVAPGTQPDFALGTLSVTFGITTVAILVAAMLPSLLVRNQVVPRALNGE